MKYYIADLHLFHENSIQFDERPFEDIEEMHSVIRNNWNEKVTNGDIVYILGDISMRGRKDDLIAFVSILKGKKVLIKGNHDDVSDYRYAQLFDEVCDYKEITDNLGGKSQRVVLCHYPILSWKNMGYGSILLYGHTHNSREDAYYQKCLSGLESDACAHLHGEPPMAINVGCMKPWINYEPRSLDELIDYMKN